LVAHRRRMIQQHIIAHNKRVNSRTMFRYRLRTLLMIVSLVIVPTACSADGSYDVMRLLLSNADLVILGEVEDERGGFSREGGTHVANICEIRIIEVLKGTPPSVQAIDVLVDLITDSPFQPKKGDRRVFFLKKRQSPREMPDWMTDDIRFGVQPKSMAAELKSLVDDMRRLESLRRR